MPTKLTIEILTAAIDGFEFQKRKIDFHIASLRAMLSGNPAKPGATPEPPKHQRRKMSAAGRKAIAEGQRKRWADSKRQPEQSQATPEAAKPKRKLSRAGRAAIIAATKRRWALKRAEAAKAKPAAKKSVSKKTPVKKTTAKKSVPKAAKNTATLPPPVVAAGGE
jgi:hypothetical protein